MVHRGEHYSLCLLNLSVSVETYCTIPPRRWLAGCCWAHLPQNIFEELDSAREWIFNETTRVLYYRPNSTEIGSLDEATGLPTGEFLATRSKVLFNFTGNQSHPVRNISISGLIMRDTAYTYMDPHGLPSGGEFAQLATGAAKHNHSVQRCLQLLGGGNLLPFHVASCARSW